MVRLPIFPKLEGNHINSLNQAPSFELPLFYMSDWSMVGLVVSDCDRAVRVLDNRFPLIRGLQGTEVLADGVRGFVDIIDALKTAGIECGVSDVVSQIYQG